MIRVLQRYWLLWASWRWNPVLRPSMSYAQRGTRALYGPSPEPNFLSETGTRTTPQWRNSTDPVASTRPIGPAGKLLHARRGSRTRTRTTPHRRRLLLLFLHRLSGPGSRLVGGHVSRRREPSPVSQGSSPHLPRPPSSSRSRVRLDPLCEHSWIGYILLAQADFPM
jgi:hypothetical protein